MHYVENHGGSFRNLSLEANKTDFKWVPAAGYAEKTVLMLASNEMPMVVNGKGETRKPIMIEAQRAGLFWELSDELLSEFPLSLSALNEDINANMRVDGKLYVLQQERPLGRENIIVRRDWLDALNLAVPDTLESLEACLYAFSEKDPDGNGKDDTYGLYLTEDYVQNLAEWLCIAYGGANGWAISEDGEFIPAFSIPANTCKVWIPFANGMQTACLIPTMLP